MIARKGVVKIENNGRKSIKAFWTVLSTVLFSLSAVLLPLLTLLKCPFWIVNLVFFSLLLGSLFLDYKKCRCPYCKSMKVMGYCHEKGATELCPRCKHLIYYD